MGAWAKAHSLLMLAALGCGPPLPDPGIVRGADLLQKSLFLERTELGDVQSISVEPSGPGADGFILVAGTKAAAFVTRTGEVQRLVRFQDEMTTPVPIDIEGDGTLEFMDRGGGWQPVSVVSHDGRTLWRYAPSGGSGRCSRTARTRGVLHRGAGSRSRAASGSGSEA